MVRRASEGESRPASRWRALVGAGARWSATVAMWTIGPLGFVALLAACGDGDPAPPDDTVDPCAPHLAPAWVSHWTPPRAPAPNACTAAQIELEYGLCEGTNASTAACAQFRNDPANQTCESCLFSKAEDASYGPIIRDDDLWKTNTAGCIALLDGDSGSSGCGAKVQAASACYDQACAACEPFASYVKCRQRAVETVCRQSYLDSVCLLRPAYASCTEYVTNQDYFLSAARFFCSHGMTANAGGAL